MTQDRLLWRWHLWCDAFAYTVNTNLLSEFWYRHLECRVSERRLIYLVLQYFLKCYRGDLPSHANNAGALLNYAVEYHQVRQ